MVREVEEGRAAFGIGGGNILVAKDRGAPLMLLAPVFQQSAVALYAKKSALLNSPADLTRLKVAILVNGLARAEILAMLHAEDIDPADIEFVESMGGILGLVKGRADAVIGYVIEAEWLAKELGLTLTSLRPSAYGVDFYGDSLFTRRDRAIDDADGVSRFVAATLKGWQYALANPKEIADRITRDLPRHFAVKNLLGFNRHQIGPVRRLTLAPIVELGHINPDRWRKMYESLKRSKAIKGSFDPSGLIFDPELQERQRQDRLVRLIIYGLATLSLIAAFAGIWLLLKRGQDRKRADKTLRESEERLKLSLRSGNIGTFFWNVRDGTHFWDDRMHEIWGLEPGTYQGSMEADFLDSIHPEDIERVKEAVGLTLEDDAEYDIEYRIIHSDNTIHHVHSLATLNRDEQGRPARLIGVCLDITEHKRMEEKILLQKDERFEGIVEAANEGIISVDGARRITLFNAGAGEIFGYSAGEVLGKPLDMLLPERFHGDHERHLREFAASPATARLMAERGGIFGRRKDGSEFPAEASISRLDMDGEAVFTVILRDISERKQAEEALIQSKEIAEFANRTKTEFLANMSHELRTPLNSIIGFSDILLAEMFGPLGQARYKDYAVDINASGRHLLELIDDILDVSRIETDTLPLSEEKFDVGRMVASCHRLVGPRAQDAGLALTMDLADGLPALYADERRMKQILLNLLTNAIKFTQGGGSVTIEAGVDEDNRMVFTVADTGPGIAPEHLESVLIPFRQADGSLGRIHGGAGLGLPLAKSLAELHGGELTLESTLGVGTTVTVALPPERTISIC